MRGELITFEGSEGSGKSTQIKLAKQYLEKKNKDVLFVREPGGVKISEKIRNILLDVKNTKMCSECETLLYMAARSQLVEETIAPALKAGKIVLCDRYLDSTIAYQGYGNGVDIKTIISVGNFATKGIIPDLTFIFDIDAEVGLSRTAKNKDRIEKRALSYHKKVRNGYKKISKMDADRIKIIKVNKGKEDIHNIVKEYINKLLHIK